MIYVSPALSAPVLAALAALEKSRLAIISADGDAHSLVRILDGHPLCHLIHVVGVQASGCVAATFAPETMDALAGLIRDVRAQWAGSQYRAQEVPEVGEIRYWIGNKVYLCAQLTKKCSFQKAGTETVERPVYRLVCE